MDAKEEELREIAKDLFQEINNEDMRARAHVQYVMKEQEKYSAECSAMVNEKYQGSKEDLYHKYDDQMNYVVKNVLFFYPDLLQKRIIVFPTKVATIGTNTLPSMAPELVNSLILIVDITDLPQLLYFHLL